MAQESLKDFSLDAIKVGVLMFCLLTFAITFMYNNNQDGLSDGTGDIFETSKDSVSIQLLASPEDSNTLLNITANTNPEASQLGSRDSVATSYEAKGSATGYYDISKKLITWVFAGTTGKILLGMFGGMLGLMAFFFIVKNIRTGT